MSSINTPIPTLPWTASSDERRFRIIAITSLSIAVIFSMIIPTIDVPELKRDEVEKVPPRLAKLVLERKKPEPPKVEAPKPEPEAEKPKVEEKKTETKPEPKPEAKPKPKTDVAAARKKASKAGVLAFQDMLSDLRDTQPAASITSSKKLQTSGQSESLPSRSILTSKAGQGSGGIDTSRFSRDTGGAQLSDHETTAVVSAVDSIEQKENVAEKQEGKGRSLTSITKIMDASQPALHQIYQRALRKNPLLKGRVVFKITIAPSGEVTDCTIVSSELNDPKLERKLVLRIKNINFNAQDVVTTTVNYPINFIY